MTERLYYKDSLLLEFDATIIEQGQHQEQHYIVLDRSAFYPTSGGQMHDTGTLNGVAVSDVIESESGRVWHLSADPVGRIGETVHGAVDRQRRLQAGLKGGGNRHLAQVGGVHQQQLSHYRDIIRELLPDV